MSQSLSPIEHIYDSHKCNLAGSKIFLDGPQSITYRQLFDRIERLAMLFERLGLTFGDRVLIASVNDAAVSTIVLALLRCGITSVPVNPDSSRAELHNLIAKAEIKAAFMDKAIHSRLELSNGESPGYAIVEIAEERRNWLFTRLKSDIGTSDSGAITYPAVLKTVAPSTKLPENIPASSGAYILFTSGTTSEPKGVELTHANVFANLSTLENNFCLASNARLLNILPLYHTDGLTQGPILTFAVGASFCRPMSFQLDRLGNLLDTIYSKRITHWITVPTVIGLAVEFASDYADAFATPDFEFVVSTAGYLDETIWRRFEEQFHTQLVNVYGLTETVSEALYCGPTEETRRIGTIGKPIDVEVRIIDEGGNDVALGEIGELIIRGDNIMKGYFNMPAATAEVLKDGWLHSGDLVRTDDDGFYQIVGRKKNIIISGGLNIYPEDVASVLRKIPGILDAVVFGVDDPLWGEKVAACVEVSGEQLPTSKAIRSAFIEQASMDLLPREIAVTRKLPRGPSGKVIIEQARQMLIHSPIVEVGGEKDNLVNRIFATAAVVFDVPASDLSPQSNSKNTKAWTSLAQVELILSVEKEFQFRMPSREVMNLRSLQDVIEAVQRHATSQAT